MKIKLVGRLEEGLWEVAGERAGEKFHAILSEGRYSGVITFIKNGVMVSDPIGASTLRHLITAIDRHLAKNEHVDKDAMQVVLNAIPPVIEDNGN